MLFFIKCVKKYKNLLREDRRRTCTEPVTVSCKMEHQPELGVSAVTKSELAKEWISTLIRPGSNLTRVRVGAKDQIIMMCETKKLKDLTNEGLKQDFR